jgi:hypothetical protein
MSTHAATAALAAALVASACTGPYERDEELGGIEPGVPEVEEPVVAPGTAPGAGGDAAAVEVADIVAEPARFAGQTVTVKADVDRVYGPTAFTLDDESLLEGGIDNDLLVIGAQNAYALDEGWGDAEVLVTGTVEMRTVADVEREVGWDLDPEIEAEFEGTRAVLIATSVTRVAD